MSDKEHNFGSLVSIYSQLLPKIRRAGKNMGYAIAVHGSMQRDLDLIAVPWVEDAQPVEELVAMIAKAVSGFVIGDVSSAGKLELPTQQPHGRRSWNICWGGNAFIDLSVMPLSPTSPADSQPEQGDVKCKKCNGSGYVRGPYGIDPCLACETKLFSSEQGDGATKAKGRAWYGRGFRFADEFAQGAWYAPPGSDTAYFRSSAGFWTDDEGRSRTMLVETIIAEDARDDVTDPTRLAEIEASFNAWKAVRG